MWHRIWIYNFSIKNVLWSLFWLHKTLTKYQQKRLKTTLIIISHNAIMERNPVW